jgi:hypothetical protein
MTRRTLIFLSAVAFLAPMLVLRAQTPQAGTGILRGIVVRTDTAEPIRDVRIAIGQGAANAQALQATAQAGMRGGEETSVTRLLEATAASILGGTTGPQFFATTDANGLFSIEGIPSGEHPFTAQRAGYFDGGSTPPPAFLRGTLTISARQTTEVTWTLIPGGVVSGRILGLDGKPVSGATVEVLRVVYQNGRRTLQTVSQNQADDRGDYRLFQLPPDEYYVAAATPGTASGPTGIVSGVSGPSQELPVRTFYPNVFDPANAAPIRVRPGDDLTGTNIQIQTAIGGKVSGRIVSQLPGFEAIPDGAATVVRQSNTSLLTLLPRDRNLADPRFSATASVSMVAPDDGRFQLVNVPPGSYDLYASLPDPSGYGSSGSSGEPAQPVSYGRATIDVRGKDLDSVELVVRRGVDMKGQVVVDGKVATAPLRLALQPDDSAAGMPVYNRAGNTPVSIQEDGSFLISAVPPATYRLQVRILSARELASQARVAARRAAAPPPVPSLPGSAYVADIRQGGVSVFDNGIPIGGQTDPLELFINTNGGAVEGTVVQADQKLVMEGVKVTLVPSENRRQNPSLYQATLTDGQGGFVMSAVPPGQYKLFAWESILENAQLNSDFLKKYESHGVSINVPAGRTISQTLTVIPLEK